MRLQIALTLFIIWTVNADWQDGYYGTNYIKSERSDLDYYMIQLNDESTSDYYGDYLTVTVGFPYRYYSVGTSDDEH